MSESSNRIHSLGDEDDVHNSNAPRPRRGDRADHLAGCASTGWGIVLLMLLYLPHLAISTNSWRLLFAAGRVPGYGKAMYVKWIGGSVNWLLPVASIGGELVKARLITQRAVRGIRETRRNLDRHTG